MLKARLFLVAALLCLLAAVRPSAQRPAAASPDFATEVLPILRANCAGCHGQNLQNGGMRIDRRSSALSNRRIVPGGLDNSLLYHRLIGDNLYGPPMPPTGALKPEQIAVIKAWIEGGAVWPDSLANELNVPPPNPAAVALVQAMRTGDTKPLMAAPADVLNTRGPDGSTPFMWAVLYTDAATLEALLKKGADANAHNDANVSPLMWASTDEAKTRVLLDHGAKVNDRSDDSRTALTIAATRQGSIGAVRLLLDHGANVNPTAIPPAESSPLIQAAMAGDAPMVQLLLERGANAAASAEQALTMAIFTRCAKCVELLNAKTLPREAYTGALVATASMADVTTVRMLLDHGADVNAAPNGRPPLMFAAVSDLQRLDVVHLLISRGANVNAKDTHAKSADEGLSVLDIALFHGTTPISQALERAGAKGSAPAVSAPAPAPQRGNTIQMAVNHALPALQRGDVNFIAKAGCYSCHNNSVTEMTVGAARAKGFAVDEALAAKALQENVATLEASRDHLHQGFFLPVEDNFAPFVLGYVMIGLDAQHYKADLNTDAAAMYIRMHQMTDGHWEYGIGDERPPICQMYVGQTALAMRGLQLYAPATDKAAYDDAIRRAGAWLAAVPATTHEDAVWKLYGLAWSGVNRNATAQALRAVLATQRADGGFSDLPSMPSNAYATGVALAALQAGGLATTDAAFARGVKFLLDTQLEDGSWLVKSRALPFQPYFDNGYPHGYDQWISAAGTGWATSVLTAAAGPQQRASK